MDGLSAAASILAVVQLAAQSLSVCVDYAHNVKNANADITRLSNELESLKDVLQEAKTTCESIHTSSLMVSNKALESCLDNCSKDLSALLDELKPGKSRKLAAKIGLRELKWPFKAKQVNRTIQSIAGYRETIILAFQTKQIAHLDNIETKIDLTKLPYVKGAAYDSFSDIDELESQCLPNTRVDLLNQIREWAHTSSGKSVFWLNGMAGTGKSTIARTLAAEFHVKKQLGASFFFKNGEGDRGKASGLFTTIACQLVQYAPGLRPIMGKVLDDDPNLADKGLRPQFEQLILCPLQQIKDPIHPLVVIVVDALDECDNEAHVKTIVELFSQLQFVQTIRVRVLITSRPELPPRLGFRRISENAYQDFILHQIEKVVIERDIGLFLEHKFREIRIECEISDGWPGRETIETLTAMAIPLFIFAATICRFVGDSTGNPRQRLNHVLKYQNEISLDQMDKTYKPILDRILDVQEKASEEQQAVVIQNFRNVVGPIVVLADYLSIRSLASLLQMDAWDISRQLNPLHSVLNITSNQDRPIRPLHLSFPNYLLDANRRRENSLWIDEVAMHRHMAYKCINLLTKRELLKQDICSLRKPGILRAEIKQSVISMCIPPDLQYACCYWVYHLENGRCKIKDDDEFHLLLKQSFLQWLEVLSILGRIATALGMITTLQTLLEESDSLELADLLKDAWRFVLANRNIADIAPLQLYSSSLIFAPLRSVVKNNYYLPGWLVRAPAVEENWNATLQTLEGHSDAVSSVAFSPDGKQLASGSDDKTVKIWDTATGSLQHTLEGHSDWVRSVAFSPDGKQLASGSYDKTVKIWDTATGSLQHTLEGHSNAVNSVAFSPDGKQLASGSDDKTVKIWDTATGSLQHTLEGHSSRVSSVAFSPDGKQLASGSDDNTVKIWDTATGSLQHTFEGHSDWVNSVAFSPDGKQLASGSYDKTVKIWDTATGSLQHTLEGHSGWVRSVAFSPDGKQLASGSDDNTVKIWDTATGSLQHTFEGHSGWIFSVAFSPDGKQLASGSYDKTVKIWDTATGSLQHTLEGHSDWVRSVAFSPDGKQLASGSDDNIAKIWDTATGSPQQTLEVKKVIHQISFHPTLSILNTNIGQIEFDDRKISERPAKVEESWEFYIDRDWIMKGNERILWLPPDHRPGDFASTKQTLALGCSSGRVIFFEFSFEGAKIDITP